MDTWILLYDNSAYIVVWVTLLMKSMCICACLTLSVVYCHLRYPSHELLIGRLTRKHSVEAWSCVDVVLGKREIVVAPMSLERTRIIWERVVVGNVDVFPSLAACTAVQGIQPRTLGFEAGRRGIHADRWCAHDSIRESGGMKESLSLITINYHIYFLYILSLFSWSFPLNFSKVIHTFGKVVIQNFRKRVP